jgi:abequosyltransferase
MIAIKANDDTAVRLSICIATLNRAAYIGTTLSSIIPQLAAGVEVVVLDGASTDGTEAIMRALIDDCPRLRYIRQDMNHGVDRDYSSAVESCSGDYVWLMTDDDLLNAGAIAVVLHALRDDPSLAVVNSEVRNADMSRVLQARRMAISTDRIFTPMEWNEFFMLAGDYLTFIGCVIIRREIWLEREKEPYFGTLFIHVGVIFQKPLPAHAVFIAKPLVAIRYGNAMWRPKEFEIWMFKWPMLIWSFTSLSAAAKSVVCKPEPWRTLATLLLYRAKGSYTATEYHRWIKPRLKSFWLRQLSAAIAYFPGALVNIAAMLYGKATRRGVRTGQIDLKLSRYYFRNWFGSVR